MVHLLLMSKAPDPKIELVVVVGFENPFLCFNLSCGWTEGYIFLNPHLFTPNGCNLENARKL